MELNEAIRTRRSIRAFLSDPVPRERIEKIVDLARWAPSWGNTQPWELVVADGEKVPALARALGEEAMKGTTAKPDIPIPEEWPEVHKGRYMGLGKALFTSMGIERGDKAARQQHYVNMMGFFGAPTVVYLVIDGGLNVPFACLDIGSIGTTFCYLACQEGLGTIFLAAAISQSGIVKKVLDIPEDKKVVIGIAVGTPDPDAPSGLFRSERDALDKILRFA